MIGLVIAATVPATAALAATCHDELADAHRLLPILAGGLLVAALLVGLHGVAPLWLRVTLALATALLLFRVPTPLLFFILLPFLVPFVAGPFAELLLGLLLAGAIASSILLVKAATWHAGLWRALRMAWPSLLLTLLLGL